ncbi:tetratricopeptide repeat protein [Oscillochloris sp. ZM17-4]|uniref:adenylate/guanylate cyclase domain-containing protein n=1 Tax=Oscillochloris sp. ZM17-4 TaxID=2866714 RepID=UPI001C73DBC9|nr:adenylate/guanylate cyclase domain-containing protein [Oscillochloris sp. ZM17-4]MBX0328653.1 tetratricopeptide repeat protein [Oscillochloris sp. ZM17-4]
MTAPLASLGPLLSHLTAEQAAALTRGGDLPAAERARLAAELRADLAACAAYIPARLVRAQLDRPRPGRTGGAFWDGSLLFADLSGFTALSERLSVLGRQGAEEVSAVVNRLFAALIAEIYAHQGALLKFGGDAITAFFDTEAIGEAHASAAAAAALAMQQRMAEFVDLQTRAGAFTLRLRVGVHSGRVFAAEVGDESHIELVITGAEVNRVAMAQEIAAPGEVVISDQTAALLVGAHLEPRDAGFQRIDRLLFFSLPPPPPDLIAPHGPDDMPDLAELAAQLEALRPYLVRGLPRRFLEDSEVGLGEFRPVSVLFANFHDFSAILERLKDDPASAAAVLNAYYRRAQAVVHRYDGIVNKVDMYTHGDKLMALFGAPAAHEDDPTRAVRCALDLERALEEANKEIAQLIADCRLQMADYSTDNLQSAIYNLQLSQKIGINTGNVFAGRVGGTTRYEYTVMGPAVNLAARLMSAGHDGDVLLSPSARAAVAGQFVLEERPPLRLKGMAEPVSPAHAVGLAVVQTNGPRIGDSPLIGRDDEIGRLFAGASAALRGAGRVLALVGEAGAGKSRIAEELLYRLVTASVAGQADDGSVPHFEIILGECQSYDQRTPYATLRAPLSALLLLSALPPVDGDRTLYLAERVRQLAPERERFAPLLGDALGIDLGESALTSALSPQQRHDRLQELIIALFRSAAASQPLLISIEDIHWADSPSLELLGGLAAAIADLPLLMVFTYRPDPPIPAPWDDMGLTVRLRLPELSPASSAELLAAILGSEPPAEILPLLERTQGNPFFIEELVRALVAGAVLVRDDGGRWRVARPLGEVALPTSIEGLLIARLDRLDEQRQELVQVASVIGRRFQLPIVQGVYASHSALDESLQRLIAIELIQADLFERTLAYLFRHALLRDVAYEGILYARRRVLHGRVARRIEELSGDRIEDQLALLAWHYLQAEEWGQALDYHMRAGEQARRRFANRDALALYHTALEIAARLDPSPDPLWLQAQVAEIHERSGDIHLLLGEYDDAESDFREALSMASAGPVWLRMHRKLASIDERRSRYDDAFAWLRTGLSRATAELRDETARCYLLGAGIYYRQGNYVQAMEWARMGLGLAEKMQSQADQAQALKLIGNIHRDQGELSQAIDALERARALFAELNVLDGLSDTLNNLGITHLQLGRWQDTVRSYEQSLQISEDIGDVLGVARTSNNLAVVLVGRNQLERAGALYQLSSEMFGRIGSALGVAVTTYNRGEVLLHQGRPDQAMALFTRSIADFERIKAPSFLPEVLRLAADATLALGERAAARDYAARSLAVADELGMAAEAAVARRALGQVALAEGDLTAAHGQLAQSQDALEQLDNRYELGKTLYQLARLAQARHDQRALADARARAEQIFTELDAARDLDLVRALS